MKFMIGASGAVALFSSLTWAGMEDWNKSALQAIDSICADTWCSGDYNYRFDSLKCDFSQAVCVLRYRSAEWPSEGMPMRFTRSGRCRMTGIRSPSDLIETTGGVRLKDTAYEQITSCLP
jgi:hypothetical protein